MKEIPLTRGYVALVDDEDFESVSAIKWQVHLTKEGEPYAQSGYLRKMHRFILGITDPSIHVDHKDGNGLNNQRFNIRVCDQAHNAMNRRKIKAKSSKFKGVSLRKGSGRWACRIRIGNKLIEIGRFKREEAAALAYNHAAVHYFGEFAKLNDVVGVLEQPCKREGYNDKRREAAKCVRIS